MKQAQCFVQGIGTAVPDYYLSQRDFHSRVIQREYSSREKRFLKFILDDSGIKGRHLVLQMDDEGTTLYKDEPFEAACTARRNSVFAAEAPALAVEAVRKSLAVTECAPGDITHLVSVTCTGFTNPGFDIQLMEQLGMSPDVQRYSLGFMGCYAAIPALDLARALVESTPDAQVLVVCAELCSLHFHPHLDKDSLLSAALFADGVGAIHLSGDSNRSKLSVGKAFSRVVPDSDGEMAWTLGNSGFDLRLSPYVSRIIGANLLDLMPSEWLDSKRHSHWAVHPGGKSILEKVQTGLSLAENALAESVEVLHRFGNMSSPTLLFILERMLRLGCFDPGEFINMLGFGPGLTVYGLDFEFNEG